MDPKRPTADDFLRVGEHVRFLPIVHGSGDFAIRVREELLSREYDCLAVPLPPSFQEEVEEAIERLPRISVVLQTDAEIGDDLGPGFSYVPIDPCQGVIAALRLAIGERIRREYIDMETPRFEPNPGIFPDPYALKKVNPAGFAAAVLPTLPPPTPGQHSDRISWMASRLRELDRTHKSVLAVVSLQDWPWLRQAFLEAPEVPEEESFYAPIRTHPVDPRTMLFALGELPYITGLYERGRRELTADDNLSVDGVKEMVLARAGNGLRARLPRVGEANHAATPLGLLPIRPQPGSLLDRRLTP